MRPRSALEYPIYGLGIVRMRILPPKKTAYAKASLLKAKNTVNDAKKPVFRPIVWHVEAYERQSCESRVRAQPSTAMSGRRIRVFSRVEHP